MLVHAIIRAASTVLRPSYISSGGFGTQNCAQYQVSLDPGVFDGDHRLQPDRFVVTRFNLERLDIQVKNLGNNDKFSK